MLRDYQHRAIEQLYQWFGENEEGNPCLVLPTGSGKSHIVAHLCKDALQNWPSTRVLMLTHVKELIEQNAERMRQHWPNAPMGVYSASVGKRQLGEPITFAGIQSIYKKADLLGHIDLVIIDECHLVSHKDQGIYRDFLAALKAINGGLRVIGLTATPMRLGHGLITDRPALFDAIIEPVTIEELVYKGHLAILRSKHTGAGYDLGAVHKRGGEFIESELQAAVDTDDNNHKVVRETIALAEQRKAWLLFCTGVKHAHHICDLLNQYGVAAGCITGATAKGERERLIADFKAGRLKALTNANVLTTGFDYPDIDLIAMLRPTMSAALYIQMAGRGMRPKSHTDHCLVLDFAGVVERHGPITAIQVTSKRPSKGEGGEAPVKVCERCDELVAISAMCCPTCGFLFPAPKPRELELRNDDIMGLMAEDMELSSWHWRKHISRTSGKEMLAVTYYGALSDPSVTEYLPIRHDGYAGDSAWRRLTDVATNAGVTFSGVDDLEAMADLMNEGSAPYSIKYKKDGKFYRVLKREWA